MHAAAAVGEAANLSAFTGVVFSSSGMPVGVEESSRVTTPARLADALGLAFEPALGLAPAPLAAATGTPTDSPREDDLGAPLPSTTAVTLPGDSTVRGTVALGLLALK